MPPRAGAGVGIGMLRGTGFSVNSKKGIQSLVVSWLLCFLVSLFREYEATEFQSFEDSKLQSFRDSRIKEFTKTI